MRKLAKIIQMIVNDVYNEETEFFEYNFACLVNSDFCPSTYEQSPSRLLVLVCILGLSRHVSRKFASHTYDY